MIPVKLTISGFLSYLDPVEIDFQSISLACISGPNGAGKSSLLDAITWALFGEARRRDDAIIHQRADAAKVTLVFDYEGNRYRIMRVKPRDKSMLLELNIQQPDGQWRVLTEHKVTDTNQRIVDILRLDYETFTNASFFLQGKADSFAQQKPGERKRILASILGLDIWEKYKEAATAKRRDVEKEDATAREIIQGLEEELASEERLRAELAEAERVEKDLRKQADTLKKLLDQVRVQDARWQEQTTQLQTRRNDLAAIRSRITGRQQRRDTLKSEVAQLKAEVESAAQVEAAYQQWQRDRQALAEMETQAATYRQISERRHAPQMTIESERSRLEAERKGLLTREREIQTLQSQLSGVALQLSTAQEKIASATDQLSQREALTQALQQQREERSRLQAEQARLKTDGLAIAERITRLEDVSQAECPLCGQPLSAADRERLLGQLRQEHSDLRTAYAHHKTTIDNLDGQIAAAESQIASLQRLDTEIQTLRGNVSGWTEKQSNLEQQITEWQRTGATRLQALEAQLSSGAFAEEARAQLEQVDAELAALGYNPQAHEALKQAEMSGRGAEEQLRVIAAARGKLTPLERELQTLTSELATEEADLLRQETNLKADETALAAERGSALPLAQTEREYLDANEAFQVATREVGYRRSKVEGLEQSRTQRETYLEKRAKFALQINQYKALERAFSKDGVPALLIEQALPELEEEANGVLDRLTDGGMTVRFNTQRDYKDKSRSDRKETLDILISDSNGTREYEMYSGGEAFRVNFAIRLALSRVLAQRSGARLQTLVIDEGFGSQDADGRQRLIEAINLVQKDFKQILVITHMEELKDAFPARIEVVKTQSGSRVEVFSG